MDLEKILKEITAGLSGDNKRDIAYLNEQCEKYKEHEYAIEILRACGRLIYDIIPNENKEELERLIDNDAKGTEAVIKEIRFNVFEGKIDKAYKLSEALITKIEAEPMFETDAVSEYYTFDNLFEELLYDYYNRPQKDIRRATIPYSEIFYIHGNLLFEMKRIPEARVYLKKAMRWNPANCTIAFEYIETFKVEKQLEEFYELTKKQFKYAYKAQDVGRCFRNLGYYYIEKNEYSIAAACYVVSKLYDCENQFADSQLYYIEHTAPDGYEVPTVELLKKYEEEYGLPRGADSDVIGLAHAYGHKVLEDGNLELAAYFLEIFYGLTEDEETSKLLIEIKEKLSKKKVN